MPRGADSTKNSSPKNPRHVGNTMAGSARAMTAYTPSWHFEPIGLRCPVLFTTELWSRSRERYFPAGHLLRPSDSCTRCSACSALPRCKSPYMSPCNWPCMSWTRPASFRRRFHDSSLAAAFLAGRGKNPASRLGRLFHFRISGPVTGLAFCLTGQCRLHAIIPQ